MNNIFSKLESILFVAGKALSLKKIIKVLGITETEVLEAIDFLKQKYNPENSGVVVLENNNEWQLVSNPDNKDFAEKFLKLEATGDLTRPQLETLTVISYKGPITKPEIEQIRGVNCSLILRNLMMRGLVKEVGDKDKLLSAYEVTSDYVRHLGVDDIKNLPDYDSLRHHEFIENSLDNLEKTE